MDGGINNLLILNASQMSNNRLKIHQTSQTKYLIKVVQPSSQMLLSLLMVLSGPQVLITEFGTTKMRSGSEFQVQLLEYQLVKKESMSSIRLV